MTRFDDSIIIEIGTGTTRKTYPMLASLITTRSKFFQKALSAELKEAQESVVKLPEEDPLTFELYLHYMYHGDFPVATVGADEYGCAETLQLARLYVFAEQLQDTKTKNATLKAFVAATFKRRVNNRWYSPFAASVRTVYERTPPNSPMRRMLVDLYTAYADEAWRDCMNVMPDEFVRELLSSFLTNSKAPGALPGHQLQKDCGLAYMEDEDDTT